MDTAPPMRSYRSAASAAASVNGNPNLSAMSALTDPANDGTATTTTSSTKEFFTKNKKVIWIGVGVASALIVALVVISMFSAKKKKAAAAAQADLNRRKSAAAAELSRRAAAAAAAEEENQRSLATAAKKAKVRFADDDPATASSTDKTSAAKAAAAARRADEKERREQHVDPDKMPPALQPYDDSGLRGVSAGDDGSGASPISRDNDMHLEKPRDDATPADLDGTLEAFQKIRDGKQPGMILFYSDSCPHCVKVKPAFAAAMQKNSEYSKATPMMVAVDCSRNAQIATDEKIDGVPTAYGYRDGRRLEEFNGPWTVDGILAYCHAIV